MAKYPRMDISKPVIKDPKTGGSITFVETEPDFEKFTQEDWAEYNRERIYKENDRLKMYIGILVAVILVGLLVFGGR